MDQRIRKIELFHSFEEEAKAEYQRRSRQTPRERIHEFALLQERCWGRKWTHPVLVPVITYEKVKW